MSKRGKQWGSKQYWSNMMKNTTLDIYKKVGAYFSRIVRQKTLENIWNALLPADWTVSLFITKLRLKAYITFEQAIVSAIFRKIKSSITQRYIYNIVYFRLTSRFSKNLVWNPVDCVNMTRHQTLCYNRKAPTVDPVPRGPFYQILFLFGKNLFFYIC